MEVDGSQVVKNQSDMKKIQRQKAKAMLSTQFFKDGTDPEG